MKKILSILLATVIFGIDTGVSQDFSITNTYVLSNVVQVVTTFNMNLIPVVASAGSPLTNSSRWGEWIPRYIDAIIYTNGLTTNNVVDTKVLWTARQNKITFQERDIYQGMPDLWDGIHYIGLSLAKERILAGQRMHVLLSIQDNEHNLINLLEQTNTIWAVSGIAYKVIEIPIRKPNWLP
jgi:hypothetical protein